ncbi:MAG: GNAT family N-acetyltransferase [Candidatus Hodarchaeales archaeon]
MDIVFREFQKNDWPKLKKVILEAENFGEPFLEHEKKLIDTFSSSPLGKVLIGIETESNDVVSYTCLELSWRAIIIKSFITAKNYQRKGIGSLMINEIRKLALKNPDIQIIRVDTGDFMDYAQKFYTTVGFQICGFVMHDMSWHNHQVHFVMKVER